MKLIVAIIQPDKLDEVHQALIAAEIFRITVSRVTGHGQQEDPELYRGEEVVPGLYRAEIDYLRREEFARTAEDILWRRSKLGLRVPREAAATLDAWLARRPA